MQDAPWKAGKPEGAAPPKKKASFKQISMTAREFSIDDIQVGVALVAGLLSLCPSALTRDALDTWLGPYSR